MPKSKLQPVDFKNAEHRAGVLYLPISSFYESINFSFLARIDSEGNISNQRFTADFDHEKEAINSFEKSLVAVNILKANRLLLLANSSNTKEEIEEQEELRNVHIAELD